MSSSNYYSWYAMAELVWLGGKRPVVDLSSKLLQPSEAAPLLRPAALYDMNIPCIYLYSQFLVPKPLDW